MQMLGLKPDVIPSKFEENLSKDMFASAAQYAVATAEGKAMDVNQLLSTQGRRVDLIVGADTVMDLWPCQQGVAAVMLAEAHHHLCNYCRSADCRA